MLSKVSLSLRLGVAFGALTLCMLLLGLAAMLEISRLSQTSQLLYQHPFTVTRALREVETKLAKMQVAMQGMVLAKSGDLFLHNLSILENLEDETLANFDILTQRYLGEPGHPREARKLFLGWTVYRDRVVTLLNQGDAAGATLVAQQEVSGLIERISSILTRMKTFAQAKALQLLREEKQSARKRYLAFSLGLAAMLLLGVFFTVVITRSVARPAKAIADQAEAMAAGDLSPHSSYKGADELGRLAASLEKLLNGVLGEGQSIKHGLPVAFWTADTRLSLTFLNQAAFDLAEDVSPPDRLLSIQARKVAAAFPDRDLAVDQLARETLQTQNRGETTAVFHGQNGERHFRVFTSSLRDLAGKVTGVMGVCMEFTDQVAAREKLRISEESFHNIFDAVSEGILVFEAASQRILELNRSAESLLGYTLGELRKMELTELAPERGEETQERLAKALDEAARGRDQGLECSIRPKSGAPFWAELAFSSHAIGGERRILLVFRDISERKAAEIALLDSVERFRLTFEQAEVGIALMDTNGQAIWANRRLLRLVGREETEVTGRELSSFMAPSYREQHRARLRELKEGQIMRYMDEARFQGRGGAGPWGQLTVSLVRDEDNQPEYFIAVINDITTHKEAQAVLESERNLRALAHHLPNTALFLVRDNLSIILAEGTLLPRLVTRPQKAVGRNLAQVFDASPLAVLAQLCRSAFDGDSPGSQVTHDGMVLKLAVTPVGKEERGDRRAMVLVQDISDFKQAEANLLAAKNMAEEANRAKNRFLTTMSHELRTPLNAIIGFSQMLADNPYGNLNEKQNRQSRRILESGRRLLDLINEVLDITQIEAGRIKPQQMPMDLPRVLAESLDAANSSQPDKGLRFSLEVEPEADGLSLVSDERLLKQVLGNLLSNAVKFTPEGGRVELSLGLAAGGREAEIRVKDSGIGIAAEDQGRIFEQFVQVDSSLSRRYEGSGLGLTLTQGLVRLLGGDIQVESEGANLGSAFIIRLPVKLDDKTAAVGA